MTLEAKNLDSPEDKRSFEHGELQVVQVGGTTISRAVFNPGWRWSTDVKPLVGTQSCQVSHTAYIISGRLGVRMDDGTEAELAAGDAHYVSPGHDAWVMGGEPCIIIDVAPAAQPAAAQGSELTGSRVSCPPCGVEFRVGRSDQVDHLIAAVKQHASGIPRPRTHPGTHPVRTAASLIQAPGRASQRRTGARRRHRPAHRRGCLRRAKHTVVTDSRTAYRARLSNSQWATPGGMTAPAEQVRSQRRSEGARRRRSSGWRRRSTPGRRTPGRRSARGTRGEPLRRGCHRGHHRADRTVWHMRVAVDRVDVPGRAPKTSWRTSLAP